MGYAPRPVFRLKDFRVLKIAWPVGPGCVLEKGGQLPAGSRRYGRPVFQPSRISLSELELADPSLRNPGAFCKLTLGQAHPDPCVAK